MDYADFHDVADELAMEVLKEEGHIICEMDISRVTVARFLFLERDAVGASYIFACGAVRERLMSRKWNYNFGIYSFSGGLSDYKSLVARVSVGE